MDKVYLILENGERFEGKAFGYDGEAVGELVFNTNMVGYIETLTDPGYCGQMIVQTFPLIGNYGIIPEDFESDKVWPSAYIVREWCKDPSNFRCEGDLDSFLRQHNIPGIYGIDTRALTRAIRKNGVMNAYISKNPELTPDQLSKLKNFSVSGCVDTVSAAEEKYYKCENSAYEVVLWDFGTKRSVINSLLDLGCSVTVMPSTVTAEEITAKNPDGIVLSNGPGDPSENTKIIDELKKLCQYNIPTFGIGLGHQLLALSQGAKTEKLLYGHRGANQPVMDTSTNKIYVTAQNHGYSVITDSLPSNAKISYINCNDNTCEGIKYENMPAVSVQFAPDRFYDGFISMMKEGK